MRSIVRKRPEQRAARKNCPARHFPRRPLWLVVCAALAQLTALHAAADSASGVDAVIGNALSPGRPATPIPYDPEALIASHSPSNRVNRIPYALPEEHTTTGGWTYSGWLELGVLGGDANESAALFRTYKDLDNGAHLSDFRLQSEKPAAAQFVEATGGGVGRHDQFYGMQFGRYNDWKVKLFYNETPHVFTSTYRSLWDGVGSDNLTLKPTTPALTPGGGPVSPTTSSDAVAAALKTIPYSELSIVRKKTGVSVNATLTETWKAYASYTHEKREGARPFGAVWGGGGGGGDVEVPESTDYTTHDFMAGVRYNDSRQSFNGQLSASLFRNNIDTMTFQNPLVVQTTAVGGLSPTIFTAARDDLVPSNEFFQARGEYARSFPELYKTRFTAVVSASSSRQNDSLVAPTLFPLTGATTPTTATSLADHWNTTNALSQQSADAKIDSTLVDLGLSASPLNALSLNGKVRYYETRNSTSYQSCNPLTGEWGRLLNEGSATLLAGANTQGGNNPAGTPASAYNAAMCNLAALRALNLVPNAGNYPIASIPYDYKQMNYRLAGEYRFGKAQTVNAAYEREDYDRDHRERDRTWEDKYKLEYANRGFDNTMLRASYEYAQRRGSEYMSDPSRDFTSFSFGPLPTANGTNVATWIRILGNLRKYDLADRDSQSLNAHYNVSPLPDLDIGVSGQWKDLKYPGSDFGRMDHDRRGSASLDVNYQPSPTWSVFGFYAYQTGAMKQGGIQNDACTIGVNGVTATNFLSLCSAAGGPLYPMDRVWYVDSRDRNNVLGLGGRYDFGRALFDINYQYSKGRTRITYDYGSGFTLTPEQLALIGNGFSDLVFTQNILESSVVVPINKNFGVRFYYRYESGKIRDWHYDGVADNPVPGAGSVYLDSGPQDYRANIFGIFLRYSL